MARPITRNSIESIEFVASSKVPSDAIDSWAVSEKGTIKAWYKDKDKDSNGLYEVYIGQNGGVKASSNLRYFFLGLTELKQADLSNLDTSKVTSMESMFTKCSSLTSLNLSSFDTSKVTSMESMFTKCSSLTSLNLSNFDTSNVASIGFMFSDTTNLTTINFDIANFNSVSESAWGNVEMFKNSGVTYITVKDEDAKTFIENKLEDGSINNVTIEVVGE